MKPCGDCYEEPVRRIRRSVSPEILKAACMRIAGLGCHNCVTRVTNSLCRLDGVYMADVALDDGLATVIFDPSVTSPVALMRSVEAAAADGHHQYWADIVTVAEVSDVLPGISVSSISDEASDAAVRNVGLN